MYCIAGTFFCERLIAKVPMGNAMVIAFIWPYAKWLDIKTTAL